MKTFAGALAFLVAAPLFAGSQVIASKAALATASPTATAIGLRVLQSGGNAADAAVAVAFALGVLQPNASGIGGGGFATYFDAKTHGVWVLDFRERSPDETKRDMFATRSARIGPIGAAVPGMVAGIGSLHERFGTQSWRALLAPAIALARDGVKMDPDTVIAFLSARSERKIDQFKSTADLFTRDGRPLSPGAPLVQSELAATLDRLAQHGSRDFYDGETAKRLVDAVRLGGGIINDRDLRAYKAEWRAPLRIDFRGYDVCAPPPPSSGGFFIAEALAIASPFALDGTPRAMHVLAEAERRASVDTRKYIGDPDFVRIPYRELLSEDRAKAWRASIDLAHASATASLVEPNALDSAETPHTTHFSIVDAAGNAASVTLTLDDDFGGGFVVPGLGFVLNDAMHDFTDNTNAIGPGRRPVSSMTPIIVVRRNAATLVAGTPGGATIPTTMLQLLIDTLARKRPLGEAVAAARFHQDASAEELMFEADRAPKALMTALAAMGHGVRQSGPIGNVAAVAVEKGKIIAVADPRHGGAAGGY